MKKIAVVLSRCSVFDGADKVIRQVLSMLQYIRPNFPIRA